MFGGVASTVHLRKQLHDMNPRCFRVSVITVPGQEYHLHAMLCMSCS